MDDDVYLFIHKNLFIYSVKTTNFTKSFIIKSLLVTNSIILLVVELLFCISTIYYILCIRGCC